MTPDAQSADSFFSGALDRIRRITVVLGIAASIVVWVRYGAAIGIGFVIGCVISYVNFHWLKKVLNELANRVTHSGVAGSTRGIVIRFLLRYGFIAVAAYVILISSKSSVYGLFGGLFLTVAAILCEAAYEVAVVLHRGI